MGVVVNLKKIEEVRKLRKREKKSLQSPIAESIIQVTGLPSHVKLLQIPRSRNWYVRFRHNGRYVQFSLDTEDYREAMKLGNDKFIDFLKEDDPVIKKGEKSKFSISNVALSMVDSIKKITKPEDFKKKYKDLTYYNYRGIVQNHIIPQFKNKDIRDVKYRDIMNFYDYMDDIRTRYKSRSNGESKPIAEATKRHYRGCLKKIFDHAVRIGLIDDLPTFPTYKTKRFDNNRKRDYLSIPNYKKLLKVTNEMVDEGKTKFRGEPLTEEMYIIIKFMINSFIRPHDLKILRHRHIEVKYDKIDKYHWLRLTHPKTKTTNHPVNTMPNCKLYYDDLIAFRKENAKKELDANGKVIKTDWLKPDDYLFMPWRKDDEEVDRKMALIHIGGLFHEIVKRCRFREEQDLNVTLYSLRHTSIMYRLMFGDEVDTLMLARNARTSPQMIDKYYGQDFTSDMAVRKLHSFEKSHRKARTITEQVDLSQYDSLEELEEDEHSEPDEKFMVVDGDQQSYMVDTDRAWRKAKKKKKTKKD